MPKYAMFYRESEVALLFRRHPSSVAKAVRRDGHWLGVEPISLQPTNSDPARQTRVYLKADIDAILKPRKWGDR